MKEDYNNMVKKYNGRTLTFEEKKGLAKKVQKIVRPIFLEREKELQNIPPSNFRF